jgi:hypothetical protein
LVRPQIVAGEEYVALTRDPFLPAVGQEERPESTDVESSRLDHVVGRLFNLIVLFQIMPSTQQLDIVGSV